MKCPIEPALVGRTATGTPVIADGEALVARVGGAGVGKSASPLVPADQRWFWTEDWQAGERQAGAEIAAGGLRVYDDMAELFADLDAGDVS